MAPIYNEGQGSENVGGKPKSLMEYIERIEGEYLEKTGQRMLMVECDRYWIKYDVIDAGSRSL